jgi:cytochrome c peroxidase
MKQQHNKSLYIRASITATLLFSGFFFASFTKEPEYTLPETVQQYTTLLNDNIAALDKVADAYSYGKATLTDLKKELAATRLAYKKAEFYLAFYYPEYCREHLNGAPLMQIEKEGTQPKVIAPEGLQVLDELVFSDHPEESGHEIAALVKKLSAYYTTLYKGLNENKLSDSYGITALRQQLIRLTSLGITGFDTPGSLNALTEVEASLEGMKNYFTQNYKGNHLQIISLFNGAIAQLNGSPSFNAFDRISFLREYIDPLYKELGRLDTSSPEFLTNTSAWNTRSTSIFSADFLNPYYFSALKKEEDSEQLRALGKSLFYDPILSNDRNFSCASCHNLEKAFTDGVPKSASNVQGKNVLRNSPTLLNAVYADRYFYDLRAFTLEQQAEHVIFNKDEFNTAYSAVIKKLEANDKYNTSFKKLFGKKAVNRENFSKALASYVLSLQSFNSDFDKFMRGEITDLPKNVKSGFNLFMGKAACATCHFTPTFSGLVPPLYSENESEILGVLENPNSKSPKADADMGRYANRILTENAWIYEKSFKTTTLRNAALTAPYFHNGAYATLEEVITFYNNGGGGGVGLNIKNQTLAPDPLNLTVTEQNDLIAFIKSLTDTASAKQ